MQTLIFSDSHLTNRFNLGKFKLLTRLIKSADRVIINGDFWDGYLVTFDTFLNSEWNKLFPILKSKKTVYLFGNHDKSEYSDKRAAQFSDRQLHQYSFTDGETTFRLEHGNRLFHTVDEYIPFRVVKKVITYIAHSRFYKKLDDTSGAGKRQNVIIKNKLKQQLVAANTIFICGHSHAREYDLKNNYINSGYFKYGEGSYILIKDGKPTLRQEKY